MDEPQKHAKKPDKKDYILYDSIYMKFLEKAKREPESRSVVAKFQE